MKFYIPERLKKNVEILQMLNNLLLAYKPEVEEDSFSLYKYNLKTNPVQKFIDSTFQDTTNERQDKITYLTNLFYFNKGTYRIFDILKEYGLIKNFKVNYSVNKLVIEISSDVNMDTDEYLKLLENFLLDLLYVQELEIVIDTQKISLTGTNKTHVKIDSKMYRSKHYEL